MHNSQPFLSIVFPSYNEINNINRGVINEIKSYLSQVNFTYEVIFSDDGSTDETTKAISKQIDGLENFRLLNNPHRGKAATVKVGVLAAKGEWILFSDFDQSTPLSEVEKLFKKSDEGYQVIIGSREMKGAVRDKEPFHRHLMGRGFNLLVRLLAIPGIQDTQCGFKLFEGKLAHNLFNRLVIYGTNKERTDAFTGAFDVEVLFIARKLGAKIAEVPIFWKHHETNRVSPLKDSIRMLYDILKIRLAAFNGKYKI